MDLTPTQFGPLASIRTQDDDEEERKRRAEADEKLRKPAGVEDDFGPLGAALVNSIVEDALNESRDPAEIAEERFKGMGLGQKLLKGFIVGGIPGAVFGGARKALVDQEIERAKMKSQRLNQQVNAANALASVASATKRPVPPLGEIQKAVQDFDSQVPTLLESGSINKDEVVDLRRRVAMQAAGILPKEESQTLDEKLFGLLSPTQKVEASRKKFLPEPEKPDKLTEVEKAKLSPVNMMLEAKKRELKRDLSAEEIGQVVAREAALTRAPKEETVSALRKIPVGTELGIFSNKAVLVLSPNLSKPEMENTAEAIRIGVERGDTDLIKQTLQNAALAAAGPSSEAGKGYQSRRNLLNEALSLKKALSEFEAAGGSTGLIQGSVEDMANKLGAVNNPKLAGFAQRLKFQILQYTRAQSGVAVRPDERVQYEEVFPTTKKPFKLNSILIDQLIQKQLSEQRTFLELYIGEEPVAHFFGRGGRVISDDLIRKAAEAQ